MRVFWSFRYAFAVNYWPLILPRKMEYGAIFPDREKCCFSHQNKIKKIILVLILRNSVSYHQNISHVALINHRESQADN